LIFGFDEPVFRFINFAQQLPVVIHEFICSKATSDLSGSDGLEVIVMKKEIEYLKKTRLHILRKISGLSIEQLNKVPEGLTLNIVWNIAHMLGAQQMITYLPTGNPMIISRELFNDYRPGTLPKAFVSQEEFDGIVKQFIPAIDQFSVDYEAKKFEKFSPFNNSYGIEHTNIDDAILFAIFHEGLHYGVISSLIKLVKA